MSLEKMIENLEELAYHDVNIKILSKMVNPLACWPDLNSPITVDEVLECINNKQEELVKTPGIYENLYDKAESEILSTEELRMGHIKKIAFFVKNEIDKPIDIDVGIPSMGHHVEYIIDDGNHRLAGAIIKGQETIKCRINGSEDYAIELKLWNPNKAFDDLMNLYKEQQNQKKQQNKLKN